MSKSKEKSPKKQTKAKKASKSESSSKAVAKSIDKQEEKFAKPRPVTAPPHAVIMSRRLGKTRAGRGFSVAEVAGAGLDVVGARRLGLLVDTKRGSKHNGNINALKKWLEG